MIRHEQAQEPGHLVYYTYNILKPFSSQIFCITSTRIGGISQGSFRSLNLSTRVGDDESNVNENRLRLCRVTEIEPERVTQAQLIHGNNIEVITESSPRSFSYKFPETDGLVTNSVNRPLFIPVADCAAVAFFDPQKRVIGLLHSGWKGVVHRINQKMVEIMQATYGSDPSDILVGVSPCLGPCCYEVRQDFISTFTEAFPTQAKDFFLPQTDDTIHFDMWSAIRWQLAESGILPEHVEGPTLCTACHVDRVLLSPEGTWEDGQIRQRHRSAILSLYTAPHFAVSIFL